MAAAWAINVHDLTPEQVQTIVQAVVAPERDPWRIVTASMGGTTGGTPEWGYTPTAAGTIARERGLWVLAYHDPRTATTWYQEETIRTTANEIRAAVGTPAIPVYFQEPTAWGTRGTDDQTAAHHAAAAVAAIKAGVAAWTFHQRVGFNLQGESFQTRLEDDASLAAALVSVRTAIDGSLGRQEWTADTTDETDFYHLDVLGSVRAITDQTGALKERHEYFPFGEEWNPPGTSIDSRRFIGKERDAETALDYFGARSYIARAGRFGSPDPDLNSAAALVDPQRWNRYAYGANNPARFVDPNGADVKDFINGVANAISSNLTLGAGRSTAGNTDFKNGQVIGDVISLAMSAVEFTAGTTATSGGVALCGTGAGCIAGAPLAAEGVVVAGHAVGVGVTAGVSLMANATGEGGGARSVNQMNQEVNRGQAPGGITRVDKGKVKGEQDNVHFSNGSSLNRDGTWKHGTAKLTKAQEEWLRENGWTVPK